ncbi:MAG: glycosyltransferase [Pseudomonadota bacterium]
MTLLGEQDALRCFGGRASCDPGLEMSGGAVVFPAANAALRVKIEAAPGVYRLRVVSSGAPLLRAIIDVGEASLSLPVEPSPAGLDVIFELDAPADSVALMPVESATMTFSAFELTPIGRWSSLLPDYRLEAVRLPHRQPAAGAVALRQVSPFCPPGWADAVQIDALESVEVMGGTFVSGPSGVVRLSFNPPLGRGYHELSAEFTLADGSVALVAPRMWAADAPDNAPPLAHFRRLAGSLYVARVHLKEAAAAIIFQPRQEMGAVTVSQLAVTASGWAHSVRAFAQTVLHEAVQRAALRVERWLGADPSADGRLAASLRLLSEADRRYRRFIREAEGLALKRWLAQPIRRGGPMRVAVSGPDGPARAKTVAVLRRLGAGTVTVGDDERDADLVIGPGERLAPSAFEAIQRVPAGEPVIVDRDRTVWGVRSAPRFTATPQDVASGRAVPLILVHAQGRSGWPVSASSPGREGGRANTRDDGPPKAVTVITPTRDAPHHLKRFLTSFAATAWPQLSLVLIDNGTRNAEARDCLVRAEAAPHVRVLRDERPFNFAALSNLGAEAADGEVLVFANNDLAFHDPGWLGALMMGLMQERVGIAGGVLSYPDGRIQHAGIVLSGEARVRHLERFALGKDVGYFARRRRLVEVSAVTGALLAIRRTDFLRLGGFCAERYPVLYNDVDLCLRARRLGLRTVLVPDARAQHFESVTLKMSQEQASDGSRQRGPQWRLERALEAHRFRQDHDDVLDADPHYPALCDPVDAKFRALV